MTVGESHIIQGGMGRLRQAMNAVLKHPELWLEAIRAATAMAPRRWWSRPPFLPVPDGEYLSWRLATAYGSPEADLRGEDLIAYLRWRKWRRATK